MLSKETKIRVLENFYSLDYVLLGKPFTEIEKREICCPGLLAEYLGCKAALMKTMVEMYKLVNLKPKRLSEKVTSRKLKLEAARSAKIARENCKILVSSSKSKRDIKNEITSILKENKVTNIEKLIQEKTREKSYRLAVDNLLIARTLSESSNYKALNSWEGQIAENVYKTLRDDLVETAIMIKDSLRDG